MQHELGVLPRLGQRVGAHSQQQRLEGLAGAVDADVRRGRGRQDPAHRIERLGPRRRAVHELAVVGATADRGPHVFGDDVEAAAVGIEDAVEVTDVAGAERPGQHLGIAVVAVPATEADVVGDVSGALLEIAHQPTPLEDLGQQVRGLLARQVDAAELRHGVVAVVEEHPLVQFLGAIEADRGVDRMVATDVEVADELVEEQAPQRLVAAAVASEQRALHDLGQIDQCEHGTIEVREVTPQNVRFVRGEGLWDVDSHGPSL